MIGVPLFVDECTSKQQRVTFARVLIEVDVTKELPKAISIEDMNGAIIEQKVHFELAPPYCSKCHVIGHNCAKKGHQGTKEQVKPRQQRVPKPIPQMSKVPQVNHEPVQVEMPQVNPEPVQGEAEIITDVVGSESTGDTATKWSLGGPRREETIVEQEKILPPIWNIVTRGQKGKDIEVGGHGVVTQLVDEAGASTFTISPG